MACRLVLVWACVEVYPGYSLYIPPPHLYGRERSRRSTNFPKICPLLFFVCNSFPSTPSKSGHTKNFLLPLSESSTKHLCHNTYPFPTKKCKKEFFHSTLNELPISAQFMNNLQSNLPFKNKIMAFQFEIKRSVSPCPSPIYLEPYILRDPSYTRRIEHENIKPSIRKNSKFDFEH
jgi:hypothetical protein